MNIQKKINTTNSSYKFSIIIPTWNNLDYLKLLIKSIRKNSHYAHQIIVHVNEGSDGTNDWIKQQKDLDYTISKENIGICYPLNFCRTLIKTEYILYMNDDMYVCPKWDLELENEIQRIGHNNFFLSSTMIEPSGSNPSVIVADFGADFSAFEEEQLLSNYEKFDKVDWNGATWPPNIVHKETWDLVGGYSNEFSPGMYSDPDFSKKLWNLGIRMFKGVAASRVYHFGTKTTKRITHNDGAKKFIKKWGITSNTFTEYYLKRGKPFNGALQEPKIPTVVNAKNSIKRFFSKF